ncbi:MAG: SGNH/GDSL hydrolase family protein [Bacteroides sp.]|nr:SGNH/GDSL hydrolase family protein [Bacteroides sp.]
MKRIKLLVVLLISLISGLSAQDVLPPLAEVNTPVRTSMRLREKNDTIPLTCSIPDDFKGTRINMIRDESSGLHSLYERLRQVKQEGASDSVRIVHVGDSHTRGRIFPRTAGEVLQKSFGAVKYTEIGINGATCVTFTRPDPIRQMAALQPELLIISLGTNESHGRNYKPDIHYNQLNELLGLVRIYMPDVPILLTTPPGSYERIRVERKRNYIINPRTIHAVNTICRYAEGHSLGVWDMYTILGGSSHACLNWKNKGMMRPDHVHYMPEAYALQGRLLAEAIIKGYNRYVSF